METPWRSVFDRKPAHLFQRKISRPDGGIVCRRKKESCFPARKTFPAIKGRPQRNLEHVQADRQTGESHHEDKAPEKPEPVNAVGKLSLYPLDEGGHSSALEYDGERYENDRYIALADENHSLPSSRASNRSSGVVHPATARFAIRECRTCRSTSLLLNRQSGGHSAGSDIMMKVPFASDQFVRGDTPSADATGSLRCPYPDSRLTY
jgi:hypothetical protein